MRACSSAAVALCTAGRRLFSTVEGSPILVACALERLPVVIPEPPAWETEYKEWSMQRRVDAAFYKTYPQQAGKTKGGMTGGGHQQGAEEDEEGKRQFQPVPRITKADASGDRRTMKRKLDQKLFLLLQRDGGWSFPCLQHEQGRSLRESAEHVLRWHLSDPAPAYFIGNAPMAHLKTQVGTFFFMCAQVHQDPWTVKLQAQAKVNDYVWVTKDELSDYIKDDELLKLSKRML